MKTSHTAKPNLLTLAILAPAFTATTHTQAQQPLTDYLPITSPNNRPTTDTEAPLADRPIGSVAHNFYIARTELTVAQYLPFAQAYDQHIDRNAYPDALFLGQWITRNSVTQQLSITPGAENFGIQTTWTIAARYTNWLHNNQQPHQSAFESGAYDTSTFNTQNPQTTRSPDARFWIPSLDEWTKANYYDPNMHPHNPDDPTQPADGYWLHPNRQNTPLSPGLPQNNGQTSATLTAEIPTPGAFPLGLYNNITSPWGLLETSGGVDEWLEDLSGINARLLAGTVAGSSQSLVFDRIDLWSSGFIGSTTAGIRVASAVPAPSITAILVIAACATLPRRYRQGHGTAHP